MIFHKNLVLFCTQTHVYRVYNKPLIYYDMLNVTNACIIGCVTHIIYWIKYKNDMLFIIIIARLSFCALLFRSPLPYYNKSACWFVVVVVKGAFTTQNYLVLKTVVVCKYVHINLLYCIITCILRAFCSLCVSLCVHFKYKRLNLCSICVWSWKIYTNWKQ